MKEEQAHRIALITLAVVFATLSVATGVAVSDTSHPSTTWPASDANAVTHVPVALTGGYDTDPRDHGRPVVLVAAGLSVPTEVFRKAFSGVKPAPPGECPTRERAHSNKVTLLKILAPYGVTNDRLDQVSNRYRYRRESGELWTHTPARITANIRNGVVTGFTILDAGSGYSTPPEITIPALPAATAKANLAFSTDFSKNGSIASVQLIHATGDASKRLDFLKFKLFRSNFIPNISLFSLAGTSHCAEADRILQRRLRY